MHLGNAVAIDRKALEENYNKIIQKGVDEMNKTKANGGTSISLSSGRCRR